MGKTMTEIETYDNEQNKTKDFAFIGKRKVELDEWVEKAAAAEKLGRMLVQSSFVPESFKPANIAAKGESATAALEIAVANAASAIMIGQSIGLDPLTSLQSIFLIKGKPSMYAKTKVAILKSLGHKIWADEMTDTSVTVRGQHATGGPIISVAITIEDAKRAGWTSNAAYAKTPADMLYARAAARVCDQLDPGALFGLPSAEDISDYDQPPRAERKKLQPIVQQDAAPIDYQATAMHIMEGLGIAPIARGAVVSGILGENFDTPDQMSPGHWMTLVDELQAPGIEATIAEILNPTN